MPRSTLRDPPLARSSSSVSLQRRKYDKVRKISDTTSLTTCIMHTYSWEAILYWLYTGVIVFAPLTASGKTDRDAYVKQYSTNNPDRPAPVSCKSVYRVAEAVGLFSVVSSGLRR